jgi:titin
MTLGDVPGAVADPTVAAGTAPGSISVTWVQLTGAATGGSAITGYDVSIWDSGSQQWNDDEASLGDVINYIDTGLVGGTKHYYRVRARNSEGPGPWSGYENAVATAGPPDAPELTATAIDTKSIRLTWTVPSANGTPGFDGYVLQKWDGSDWEMNGDLLDGAGDTSSTTLYIDGTDAAPLMPGTTYYYRIRTETSPPGVTSELASATTVAGAPDAPVLTRPVADADITSTSVTLRWTAPTSNGGNAIIRYEVERWDTASKQWVSANNAIPNTSTSATISSLQSETRYAFRLRAVNRAPTNNGLGTWSTMIFVTTD